MRFSGLGCNGGSFGGLKSILEGAVNCSVIMARAIRVKAHIFTPTG